MQIKDKKMQRKTLLFGIVGLFLLISLVGCIPRPQPMGKEVVGEKKVCIDEKRTDGETYYVYTEHRTFKSDKSGKEIYDSLSVGKCYLVNYKVVGAERLFSTPDYELTKIQK